jgi:hypothetical protein
MKKLLFILTLFASLAASSQCPSCWVFLPTMNGNTGITTPPTGTVVRTEAEAFDTYSSITPTVNNDADASLYYVLYSTVGGYGDYTINTAAAGTHAMTFRVLTTSGSQFFVKNSAGFTIATVNASGNPGWQTISGVNVTLGAGSQKIEIVSNSTSLSINWFTVDNSLTSNTSYYTFINFSNEFFITQSPWTSGVSIWNTLKPQEPPIATVNGVTKTLINDHLLSFGRTIVNTTAWTGSFTAPTPNIDGAGVFSNNTLYKGWKGPNGSRVKITNLDPTKTYDFWILANTQPFENTTVNFTVTGNNTATTGNIVTANNYGSSVSYPDWRTDPALAKVTNITPDGSGNVIITGNLINGPFVSMSVIAYKQN